MKNFATAIITGTREVNFRVYYHILRGIGQLTSVCEELLKRIIIKVGRTSKSAKVSECGCCYGMEESWRFI